VVTPESCRAVSR